jgi:hypothetical protein
MRRPIRTTAVDLKQKTIGEIIESENWLVLAGPERYGAYYTHALDASVFLTHFIKSLDSDRFVFGRYYSQVKKHHLLALFSTVRLHQVQSTMNLRQVLEAGSLASFAIANPDPSHFVTEDKNGLLNSSQKLTSNAYKWLDQHYPEASKGLKEMKDNINASTAHANLVYTGSNFEVIKVMIATLPAAPMGEMGQRERLTVHGLEDGGWGHAGSGEKTTPDHLDARGRRTNSGFVAMCTIEPRLPSRSAGGRAQGDGPTDRV